MQSMASHERRDDPQEQEEHAGLVEVILERLPLSYVTGERTNAPLFGVGLGLDPCEHGGLVQVLAPGGAAERSGKFQVGDVVVTVDGHRISGMCGVSAGFRNQAERGGMLPRLMLCLPPPEMSCPDRAPLIVIPSPSHKSSDGIPHPTPFACHISCPPLLQAGRRLSCELPFWDHLPRLCRSGLSKRLHNIEIGTFKSP